MLQVQITNPKGFSTHPARRRSGANRRILGTVELTWLGGGDVPPGGNPQLAAQLPWLQRTAGSDGGGSREAGSRKMGSGKAAAGGPPATAAALWEAAATLAGVKAGSTKLPPRRGLAPLPPAPRLPPFAPRTPQQDDGDDGVTVPAADAAAASDAAVAPAAQVLGCACCTLHQYAAREIYMLHQTLHTSLELDISASVCLPETNLMPVEISIMSYDACPT